jgi:hypothetical protein
MSDINQAYGLPIQSHWEKQENPEHFDYLVTQYVHPVARQHMLGFVGGNEVSMVKGGPGGMTDIESDLKGINIPNTFCQQRQYKPLRHSETEIIRDNTKGSVRINLEKNILPSYQMWAYPAVVAPLPMVNEVCMKPEKY